MGWVRGGRRGEEGKCGESVVIFGDLGRKGGIYYEVPMLDFESAAKLGLTILWSAFFWTLEKVSAG